MLSFVSRSVAGLYGGVAGQRDRTHVLHPVWPGLAGLARPACPAYKSNIAVQATQKVSLRVNANSFHDSVLYGAV